MGDLRLAAAAERRQRAGNRYARPLKEAPPRLSLMFLPVDLRDVLAGGFEGVLDFRDTPAAG
jgi:hypothetical protein